MELMEFVGSGAKFCNFRKCAFRVNHFDLFRKIFWHFRQSLWSRVNLRISAARNPTRRQKKLVHYKIRARHLLRMPSPGINRSDLNWCRVIDSWLEMPCGGFV